MSDQLMLAKKYEVIVVCPKCSFICALTEKRDDGYYDDDCWNCHEKFPLIKVEVESL